MSSLKQSGGKKFKSFIKNELNKQKEVVLRVGFFKNAKYDDGTQVASVAAINNFGSRTKTGKVGIPARPFFTQAMDIYKKNQSRIIKDKFKPNKDQKKSISEVGEIIQNTIQKRITDLKTPPKSAKTLKLHPTKTNPLINTGLMRRSVIFMVDDK